MRYLAGVCVLLACFSEVGHAADTKAQDIVAKHLDSIGNTKARAAVRSRGVQGTLRFKIQAGGAGETVGKWERVSQQTKSNFIMQFGEGDWLGERFVYDGEKTSFGIFTASHRRSEIAEFVRSQDFIVKDGLLGGELSTAWALENLDRRRAKLNYIGVKKIGGRELQGLEYLSPHNNEMTVKLYFDPETHRHVMTVYSVFRGATVAHSDLQNARQKEIRYTIEERFSDFQTDKGITLPRHYDLQYERQLQDGSVCLYDWDMTADKTVDILDLDPGNFQIK